MKFLGKTFGGFKLQQSIIMIICIRTQKSIQQNIQKCNVINYSPACKAYREKTCPLQRLEN